MHQLVFTLSLFVCVLQAAVKLNCNSVTLATVQDKVSVCLCARARGGLLVLYLLLRE